MPVTLMYHDVVPAEQYSTSGFAGAAADRYKLTVEQFTDHLQVLGERDLRFAKVSAVCDAADASQLSAPLLTFDDGGLSAHTVIAGALEARRWPGHFFITTNFVNKPGFLSSEQVRDLHRRGHVIGSHSCSHPLRISSCSTGQILDEWRTSRAVLEQMIGAPVVVASVPGGFYSREVGIAAAKAGMRYLFTSEPTTRIGRVGECYVLGRFAVVSSTSPQHAADLVCGHRAARSRQAIYWKARKIAKAMMGRTYLKLRSRILEAGE